MFKKHPISPTIIILIFFIIALITEVYIFNFRFWVSLGYKPIYINLPYDDIANETSGDFSIDVQNVKTNIQNIGFYFSPIETTQTIGSTITAQYSPKITAKISVQCDKKNGEKNTYSKEYAYYKNRINALTINAKNTQTIHFTYKDAYLKQLSFNIRYDFSFSLYRFCIVFFLLCFIYCFRSGSKLWTIRFFDDHMHVKRRYLLFHLLLNILIFFFISSLLYSNPFFNDIPEPFLFDIYILLPHL